MALHLLTNDDIATTAAIIPEKKKKQKSFVSRSSISRWASQSTLKSGPYASVSLAIDLDDGLMFVVKSTSAETMYSYRKSPELTAMESEISILRSLNCAHVISYLGDNTTYDRSGHAYRNLFLEYMEGGSVSDLLKRCGGRLQEEQVRRFTRDLVEGLTYLHAQEIVHCDIKGQNLLVGSSSESVKIADFNLARKVSEDDDDLRVDSMLPRRVDARGTSRRSSSDFKGTPFWMAPEALQGVEQSFPSDIWSLGCTVVEMCQGCPPWVNLPQFSFVSIITKIACSDEDPPLPEYLSEEGKDFLNKCFQRDPRKRWTALQLLHHPFLEVKAASAAVPGLSLLCTSPPSPRSTLDSLSMDSEEDEDGFASAMDNEDDEDGFASVMSSICTLSCQ